MPLKRFFVFAIALFICASTGAQVKQGDVWDTALDRYEKICDECIGLKARIAAGEKVTREEANVVIMELSQLRQQLNGENGQMSAQQRERFNWIKECFEQGKKVSECERPSPQPSTEKDAEKTSAGGQGSAEMPEITPSPSADAAAGVPESVKKERRNNVKIVLLAGFNPFSFGGMLMDMPGRFGGYAKVLSTIRPLSYSYSCKSDGTAVFPDGSEGLFLAAPGSGTRHSHLTATAGLAYAPKPFVDVRAGIGYGWDRYYWTDRDGGVVLVSDKSFKGIAFDLGADFNWKRLTVGAGVETIMFKTVTPYLGIGVNF